MFQKFLNTHFVLYGQSLRVWLCSVFFSGKERNMVILELLWLNYRMHWKNILKNWILHLQIQIFRLLSTLCTKLISYVIDDLEKSSNSSHGMKIFLPAPAIDSETGHRVLCEEEDICSKSSESSLYLMQNLRVGDSNCLTFFYL